MDEIFDEIVENIENFGQESVMEYNDRLNAMARETRLRREKASRDDWHNSHVNHMRVLERERWENDHKSVKYICKDCGTEYIVWTEPFHIRPVHAIYSNPCEHTVECADYVMSCIKCDRKWRVYGKPVDIEIKKLTF